MMAVSIIKVGDILQLHDNARRKVVNFAAMIYSNPDIRVNVCHRYLKFSCCRWSLSVAQTLRFCSLFTCVKRGYPSIFRYMTALFINTTMLVPTVRKNEWYGINKLHLNSGCRRELDEICALLGYYAAYNGNSLWTFRDNLQVPFSRADKTSIAWPLKVGPTFFPGT